MTFQGPAGARIYRGPPVLPTVTTRWEDRFVVKQRPGPSPLELVGLGATITGCVVGGLGGGYWLGSATGSGTVMTFSGLAVGLIAAFSASYFMIKRYL